MKKLMPTFAILIICMISCGVKQANQTQALKLESDKDKLLIFEKIPHGITYQELRKQIPEVTDQTTISEETKKHGQFKAYWPTTIFNKDAKIEFNIIYDTLHTYYFWLDNMDSTIGWDTYRSLQQFYEKQYGAFKTENEDWEGYVRHSSCWPDDKKAFGITLSIYGKRHLIGWGY